MVKPKYDNIESFFNDIKTDELEELIPLFGYDTKWEVGQEFNLYYFQRFLKGIRDGESDWKFLSDKAKDGYGKLPLKVVNYEHASSTDMDHGALTDTYTVKINNKFYEFDFHYYGQYEFDKGVTKHEPVFEVVPKEITTIKYERV